MTVYVIMKRTELSFQPTSRSLCKIDYCSFGTIIGYLFAGLVLCMNFTCTYRSGVIFCKNCLCHFDMQIHCCTMPGLQKQPPV